MENLNAEQIVKALECCIKADTHYDCGKLNCPALINDECIYTGITDQEGNRKQFADALSIIKELTEEKETLAKRLVTIHDMSVKRERELTEENKAISERYAIQVVTAIELDKQVQKLADEIERLKEDNVFLNNTIGKNAQQALEVTLEEIEKAKADTVQRYREKLYREFASLGSKDKFNKEFFLTKADQIAKEMIGGHT